MFAYGSCQKMPQTNLFLTFGSGEAIFLDPCFWVYVRSATQFIGDKVILTDGIPKTIRVELEEIGFQVVIVPRITSLLRDRHFAYWKYLQKNFNYRHVLVSDCRDVLFQKNPFDWPNFDDEFVLLTSEGFHLSRSGFACIDNFEFQRNIPALYHIDTKTEWVINGGISLGTPLALTNFHFLVWVAMTKSIGRCTDQSAYNWLLAHLKNNLHYKVSFPDADFCLTGESVREGIISPVFDDMVKTPNGLPYHIVHQFDRLNPEFVEKIKETYHR